jgi:hypothetical protein
MHVFFLRFSSWLGYPIALWVNVFFASWKALQGRLSIVDAIIRLLFFWTFADVSWTQVLVSYALAVWLGLLHTYITDHSGLVDCIARWTAQTLWEMETSKALIQDYSRQIRARIKELARIDITTT